MTILIDQLRDPFRIGLIAALLVTAHRTMAVTGSWTPLAIGAVFVAVLIPNTMSGEAGGADRTLQIGVGLASNAVLIAAGLAIKAAVTRLLDTRG